MNKTIALFSACAALTLAIPAFATTPAGGGAAPAAAIAVPAASSAKVGEKAPDFTLTDTNGKTHSLHDYAGKTVVLEWTNHECPFVKKHYDAGNMQVLQQRAAASGTVWLTIASSAPGKQGNLSAADANALIAKQGSSAAARLSDENGAVGKLYGARTTPHMYVIDKTGTLVYAGAIDDAPSADAKTLEGAHNYVTSALAALALGQPVKTAQTQAYGCAVKYAE